MRRIILLAALGGFTAFMAYLPLAWVANWALPDAVTSQTRFHGTVWQGGVTGLPIFETAEIKLNPLSQKAEITAGQGRSYLYGTVGRKAARDVQLIANIADMPITDGRLAGLSGRVEAKIEAAQYDLTSCQSITGTVATDVLTRNGGRMNWTGPELSGPLRCEDGALVAELSGRDAGQVIDALIRLSPAGTYRADVSVRTNRAEADSVLPLFGFTRQGRDFKLTEQGNWR